MGDDTAREVLAGPDDRTILEVGGRGLGGIIVRGVNGIEGREENGLIWDGGLGPGKVHGEENC